MLGFASLADFVLADEILLNDPFLPDDVICDEASLWLLSDENPVPDFILEDC